MRRLSLVTSVLLITLLNLVPSAKADRWTEVGRNELGKVSVDEDSITGAEELVSSWVYSYSPNNQIDVSGYKFYHSIHCGIKQYQVRRLISFNRQGSVMQDRNLENVEPFRPIIPGSIADSIREFVCSSQA